MKKVTFDSNWPESYKVSYNYDLLEIYNEVPKKFLGYTYHYLLRYDATLDLIKKYAKQGGSILDVAAAQGNFSLALAELGYDVTWNDLRSELVDYVKLKYEKGKINFAPGNVFELGFKDKFDVVLVTEIIEHVAHPDDFLSKIAEMIKPGGFIVMTTPNGAYFLNDLPKFSDHPDPSIFESVQFKPNSDGHIFLLYREELYTFAKKTNLNLLETKFYSNFISSGHLKSSLLLPFIPKALLNLFEKIVQKSPLFIKKKISTGIAAVFQKTNY